MNQSFVYNPTTFGTVSPPELSSVRTLWPEIHEDFGVCVTRSANHTGFHADKRAMCRVFVDSLPQEGKEYIKGLVTPKEDMPSFKNSPQSISAEDQLQLKDVWKIPIRAWTALSQSFVAVKSWYYLERVQVARNKEIEEALDVRNRVWVDDAKGGSQQVRGWGLEGGRHWSKYFYFAPTRRRRRHPTA